MAEAVCDEEYSKENVLSLNSPDIISTPNENGLFDEKTEEDDAVAELKDGFQSENNGILNSSKDLKNKSLPRRVSFPDDDKIISGYGEPRNPWAQAKTTSTEELIQAYTQSCQQWGVKPITKLLVQLQEIKDFSVRANSLTLKGEKLDSKVVETLESVFKRVQFVIMDLEATNLDDDSAAALFDMIEYYESAVNVLVGFNKNLGTRGWQAAAHMMRKMSCLRLFDGHSVPLSDQAVPFVGRALRLSNTLVTLHLENSSLSGRPMLLIVAALRMNVTLRELFLADNRLISTDALQIANLLKFNIILQLLDIRNNLIQDAGLCHLCSGLMAQPQHGVGGLQTLVLWNNQLSHQSMGRLAMTLRNTTSLSTLNLGQNVLSDDGAAKLKDGLLQNHSLLRLGLVGTKLTCEGAIALAEFLAESPRIIRLDLRNNNIRVGGLMALSLAFKINYSLLRLDIDKPNAKESLKELAEKQDSLLNDITEYATRNKEQAYQRVLSVHMERQRRFEEEKTAGLRYMDMTNSEIQTLPLAMQAVSQNNSNNKKADKEGSANEDDAFTRDVDDSPLNSPEFLPANSVSYHQVSPVMFSSSEMEKRAALALHEASHSATATAKETGLPETLTDPEATDDLIVKSQSPTEPDLPTSPVTETKSEDQNSEGKETGDAKTIETASEPPQKEDLDVSESVGGKTTDQPTENSVVIATDATLISAPREDYSDCDTSTEDKGVTISHFDLSLFPH
uniref:Protein phosphatase 1 regulatory subunit 37 n=1 Tax=Phallusia mammillata TaxID=59560 RepID=A0A6F9DQ35_9ASCI|nr:protein phosphatase 1 regulatory subunit 37 [Phallusia mammillata]